MSQQISEIQEYNSICPLLAAAQGRDKDERWLLFAAFQILGDKSRNVLTSPETIDQLKRWAVEGVFPAEYLTAVSKLIGLVALDDEVTFDSVEPLLQKIGLSPEQAMKTHEKIVQLLQPLIEERARESVPEKAPELPPLTTKIPPIPESAGSQVPARNIINLRKEQ